LWLKKILHFFFPHICQCCGTDILSPHSHLCLRCLSQLPVTGFERLPHNPVEKIFWGRLPVMDAYAQYYFSKQGMVQHLMHQLKYHQNKEVGLQLGRLMGQSIKTSGRFRANALVPLPLFKKREKKRGYNQATILCEGIAEITGLPVWKDVVIRPEHTETQTKKGRVERWKNIEGKFLLAKPEKIEGKHIILVDDVITTGATLESCGQVLLGAKDCMVSIAALAYTSK